MTETKRVCALICEYNPFHFGHRYQLGKLKEIFSLVICILGGNVSQRGEVAVSDRYVRARAAIHAGADLVAELPIPWCCASAHEFAAGGVFLAKALGADVLAFSAESDAGSLYTAASERKSAESAIRELMKREGNLSYPAAAERVLGKTLAGKPNDILGIEYIACAEDFPTYILKREPSYLSSSAIRSTDTPLSQLPEEVKGVFESDPSFPRKTETVGSFLLATLLNTPHKDVYGVPEELYARMTSLAGKHDSFHDFLQGCVNKVYTASRIRRAAWSMTFGFPKNLSDLTPPYTLLLAANGNGRRFLKATSNTRTFPVVSRPAALQTDDVYRLNVRVNDVLRLYYGGTNDREKTPYVKITDHD